MTTQPVSLYIKIFVQLDDIWKNIKKGMNQWPHDLSSANRFTTCLAIIFSNKSVAPIQCSLYNRDIKRIINMAFIVNRIRNKRTKRRIISYLVVS